MELSGSSANPVYTALNALHADPSVFSYGISDNPAGLALYPGGAMGGILTTGKPGATLLPHPFDQVPGVGAGHQIHHKFVACGFGQSDAVIYCGSSNLAQGGEHDNGDNLLAIQDGDVVTAFVIETLLLVDHFNFLDRMAVSTGKTADGRANAGSASTGRKIVTVTAPSDKRTAAVDAGWFLETNDAWVAKYFVPGELRFRDRELFA
ncbi:hypothetical protein [Labrys neptuniae]